MLHRLQRKDQIRQSCGIRSYLVLLIDEADTFLGEPRFCRRQGKPELQLILLRIGIVEQRQHVEECRIRGDFFLAAAEISFQLGLDQFDEFRTLLLVEEIPSELASVTLEESGAFRGEPAMCASRIHFRISAAIRSSPLRAYVST